MNTKEGGVFLRNYNFHGLLEWREFELLVCDLVQVKEGIILETFKEGRDYGIDGLYQDEKHKIIVQVKRHKPDLNRLLNHLKNNELPKIGKLNPNRYILGLSMDLKPGEKKKIKKLFEGYIQVENDIIDQIDMNNLLSLPQYKHVELSCLKLWVPSINVFQKTLRETVHSALYKESEMEFHEAIKRSKTFVPTRIYRKALQHFYQKNVIILSGEPGVGKTTMAHLLALAFLQPNNLDGYVWANSIKDVYTLIQDDQVQIVIFDDFWGSIFENENRRRNHGNQLKTLLNLIIDSNGRHRLILTTREYVLQQGLQKNLLLKETLEQYSMIFTIEEYGYDEKASMFFNHIYTSTLEYPYVEYLYRRSDKIIYHTNYNPRVLATFLDRERKIGITPEDYFYELCSYLDYPTAFWEDVFIELSEEARIVAILLFLSSTPMLLSDIETCYQKYINRSINKTKVKNLGVIV